MDKNWSKKRQILHDFREVLLSTTVGALSFPIALGSMQNFVFKPLRITCKLRNSFVSTCGFVSVFTSGVIASGVFLVTLKSLMKSNRIWEKENTSRALLDLRFSTNKQDIFIWGAASVAVFKMFGGKGRYVIPSHLFYPGAFAKKSISAPGKNYAGSNIRRKLYFLGRRDGCHSCGKKREKCFHADHIPPNKLLKPHQLQQFYPQCKSCSQKQGGALSSLRKYSAIKTHGTTLRFYHIWLPVPLAIALIRNALDDETV